MCCCTLCVHLRGVLLAFHLMWRKNKIKHWHGWQGGEDSKDGKILKKFLCDYNFFSDYSSVIIKQPIWAISTYTSCLKAWSLIFLFLSISLIFWSPTECVSFFLFSCWRNSEIEEKNFIFMWERKFFFNYFSCWFLQWFFILKTLFSLKSYLLHLLKIFKVGYNQLLKKQ